MSRKQILDAIADTIVYGIMSAPAILMLAAVAYMVFFAHQPR